MRVAFRNAYDPKAKTRNFWTSIPGLISVLVSLAVAFGLIEVGSQAEVNDLLLTIYNAVFAIWTAIQGLILIFKAKDSDITDVVKMRKEMQKKRA